MTDIVVENNTIDTWFRGPAIRIGDAHRLQLKNNTLAGPPHSALFGRNHQLNPAVVVDDADTVAIEHNSFTGYWSSLEEAIFVQHNTTDKVRILDNTLHH